MHKILMAILVFGSAAHADTLTTDVFCDDRQRLEKSLTQTMGAERQGMGLRDPETVMELWVRPDNGEWLFVHNYANGTSCIVAMGEHWQGELQSGA